MTHSLNGNICAQYKRGGYNRQLVNVRLVEFYRRNFGGYTAEYDPDTQLTAYTRKRDMQPFIDVMEKPKSRNLPCGEDKVSKVIVRVGSGSHIGFSDTEYAREIYDVTMKLKSLLQRDIDQNLSVLFDDETQLYLPRDFREIIKMSA